MIGKEIKTNSDEKQVKYLPNEQSDIYFHGTKIENIPA